MSHLNKNLYTFIIPRITNIINNTGHTNADANAMLNTLEKENSLNIPFSELAKHSSLSRKK